MADGAASPRLLANDRNADGHALAVTEAVRRGGRHRWALRRGRGNAVLHARGVIATRRTGAGGLFPTPGHRQHPRDGEAQVTVDLASVNDGPVIDRLPDIPRDRGMCGLGGRACPRTPSSDIDGDSLTISLVQADGAPLPALADLRSGHAEPLRRRRQKHFQRRDSGAGRLPAPLDARRGRRGGTAATFPAGDSRRVNDAPRPASGGAFLPDRVPPPMTRGRSYINTLQQGLFTDVEGDPLTYAIRPWAVR